MHRPNVKILDMLCKDFFTEERMLALGIYRTVRTRILQLFDEWGPREHNGLIRLPRFSPYHDITIQACGGNSRKFRRAEILKFWYI